MNLSQIVDLYHNLADDKKEPSFAEAADVIGWLNEAEREAAFRMRLLISSIQIGIKAATPKYLVGFNGIWIRRVKLAAVLAPLGPADYRDLDQTHHGWQAQTGTPTNYVIGLDSIGQPLTLRLYPIPIVDDEAELIIVRHPLEAMAAEDSEPEVESRWHEELVHWALYRGYSRPDADSMDVDKSLKYYERFEKTFGTREAAIEAEAQEERARANRVEYATGLF